MAQMININKIITSFSIFLMCFGIFVGEYLRPKYIHSLFLGSIPNFIGGYVLFSLIISLLFKSKKQTNKINNRNRIYLFFFGIIIFVFLTLEEYFPFFTASKTFDFFDIVASAIGVLFAFISLEILIYLKNVKNKVDE
jgi:hypothetical protein